MNIKTHVKKLIGLSLKRYTETHLRATNNRIDNIVAQSGNDNSELVDARIDISGVKHTTLNNRIVAEVKNGNVIEQEINGSHISVDTNDGYINDLVIEGNTIQDQNNLADIRSVGDKVEGQDLYKIPLLCTGKNLFDGRLDINAWENATGNIIILSNYIRSVNFTKVNPDTQYVLSNKNNKNTQVQFRRKNGTIINAITSGTIITTPNNCHYISMNFPNATLLDVINVQIEEGTVATPYEPYQEHKLTILSPTQIEKVGDVSDIIIEKDGVWGVEKNIVTDIYDDNQTIQDRSNSFVAINTMVVAFVNTKLTISTRESICRYFKPLVIETNDVEGYAIAANGSGQSLYIRILRTKLTENTIEGVKNWLASNNIILKYKADTPQFIPLPQSQQVKLRTFANKTNISFLTEIEGTIKGKAPKSLSATVNTHTTQIDNLNKDLERVNKLEESTVSVVKNDGKDFVSVESTNQGYFEDVRLEGKTLVNISPRNKMEFTKTTNDINRYMLSEYQVPLAKKNMLYTIIVNVTSLPDVSGKILLAFINGSNMGSVKEYYVHTKGVHIFKMQTTNVDFPKGVKFRLASPIGGYAGVYSCDDIVILEGDHTQAPPGYFEGLKSVGEGTDEIEVSSCNENLFNFNSMVKGNSWIPITKVNDLLYFNNEENINKRASSWFRFYCNKGDVITVKTISESSNYIGLIFSKDTGFSEDILYNKPTVLNTTISWTSTISGLVYFRPYSDINSLQKFNCKIMLNKGTTPKPYTPHKSNKKPLLRYNDTTQVWEKPILREWDYAEKRSDGEYYNVEKSGQVVLNGSENWNAYGTDVNTIGASYNLLAKTMSDGICDIVPFINSGAEDSHHIMINSKGLLILWIEKNKLETQSIAGFKKWLQTNPVTLTYQLAEPKEYECTNIDLIAYPNETNLQISSGPITTNLTAKYHGNIANTMIILQNKVNLLENKFMAGLKSVLAGNMQDLAYYLYPDDFVDVENHKTTTLPL